MESTNVYTAANRRIHRLFHYRDFNVDRFRQLLSTKKIFLSNPLTFNDPWDCRPWFNLRDVQDPGFREHNATWYIKITKKHMPEISDQQINQIADKIRNDPEFLRSKIEESSAHIAKAISDRYRVFCTSTKPDCELMWAHYGNKHQGVCLEFGTNNTLFSTAIEVEYRQDYPKYDLASDSEFQNLAPLIVKSASWSYENEYRLIVQERANSTPDETLKCDGGLILLPDRALQSVILGCSETTETRSSVKQLVAEYGSNITIKEAIRAPDRYQLDIQNHLN